MGKQIEMITSDIEGIKKFNLEQSGKFMEDVAKFKQSSIDEAKLQQK